MFPVLNLVLMVSKSSPLVTLVKTKRIKQLSQLWDIRENLLTVFQGHKDWVRSAIFSPDGQQILTASNDNTARLWDRQGNLITILQGHKNTVISAIFIPNGQKILTTSLDDTTRLWDHQGNLLTVFQQGSESAIFSPDSLQVLTVGFMDARLWNLQGNLLAVFKKEMDIVLSGLNSVPQFSPNGQYILISSREEGTSLWDTKGNLLATFPIASGFSPDGRQILTGLYNTVRLWDVSDAIAAQSEKVTILQAFQKDVARNTAQLTIFHDRDNIFTSALFSPDSQKILTTSDDKTVRLWNRQGNLLIRVEIGEAQINYRPTFSPDGQKILTVKDNIAQLWDQQGNLLTELRENNNAAITRVEFSPNGRYILTNSSRDTVRLWDHQGNLLVTLDMGNRDARFSADGQYILGTSGSESVHIWNL